MPLDGQEQLRVLDMSCEARGQEVLGGRDEIGMMIHRGGYL